MRRDRDAVALHRQHGELAFQDVQSRARAAVERALERLYVYLLSVEDAARKVRRDARLRGERRDGDRLREGLEARKVD